MAAACCGVMALATAVQAAPQESVTFTNVISDGAWGTAVDTRTTTFSGAYVPKSIRLTGALTKVNSATFRSEARVYVLPPSGAGFELQPALQTSFTGPTVNTNDLVLPIPTPLASAAGLWTFKFFESFDDGGVGSVDSTWDSIQFTLDDALPDGLTTLSGPSPYLEVEPNDNTFPNNSTNTSTTTGTGNIYGGANMIASMAPGESITGTTTGAVLTTPGATSVDNFLIRTATASTDIYKYQLSLTTTGTASHTCTLRGFSQNTDAGAAAPGVILVGSDGLFQTHVLSGTTRVNQWYAFGKGENVHYRVAGTTTTTAPYSSVLSRTTVTPIDLGTLGAGPVTIGRAAGNTNTVSAILFDSNLNAIVDGSRHGFTTTPLVRTLGPGVYYLAVSNVTTSNSLASPVDSPTRTNTVMTAPDGVINNSTTTVANLNMTVSTLSGDATSTTAAKAAAFDVAWFKFTLEFVETGACCRPDGTCFVTIEGPCDTLGAGAVFHPGESCPPAAGCAPGGACCLTDGSCSILIQSVCEANPNFYRWTVGGSCAAPNQCVGRCCHADGTCTTVVAPLCNLPGDNYGGDGTACSGSGDECKGRCCEPNGNCSLTGSGNCLTPNRFGGLGTSCADVRVYGNPTPPTVAIPGVGAAPLSVINVPDSILIQDVDVRIKISHTFRADINMCLTGPGGSPTVQLTAGTSCSSGGNCGAEDNYNVIYNDEGAAIVCASANLANLAATPDQVIPAQALSAFDGLLANGDWTLAIVDDLGGDSGTLLEWSLLIDSGTACIGACCNGLACTRVSSEACGLAGGIYQGDATFCTPSPCAPNGACCLGTGCSIQAEADCGTAGGVYGGDNSTCASPAPCQAPCCKANGTCDLRTIASCNALAGAVAGALGTGCPAPPCAPLGACCAADGSCTAPVTAAACTASGGVRWTAGAGCSPNLCRGRCCAPNGDCSVTFPPGTIGAPSCEAPNVYGGDGLDCSAVTPLIFDNIGLVIPDSPAPAVSDVQVVSGLPTHLTDVDVDVFIAHTFFADLVISVEHNGVIVALTNGTQACIGDDPNIVLDDEGTGGPIQTLACPSGIVPSSPPNYTPLSPLSAFDGMDPNGPWTISIRDDAGLDTGTLRRWSLHISTDAPVCPVVGCTCYGDMNGDSIVDGADIAGFTACVVSGGGAGCACADMDHVGGVDANDVDEFVAALLAGTCGAP